MARLQGDWRASLASKVRPRNRDTSVTMEQNEAGKPIVTMKVEGSPMNISSSWLVTLPRISRICGTAGAVRAKLRFARRPVAPVNFSLSAQVVVVKRLLPDSQA
jgi:hypothetical protein